jgi:hypothetical protein
MNLFTRFRLAWLLWCSTLLLPGAGLADQGSGIPSAVEQRKREFLAERVDEWSRAGYPVKWKHDEWKFNEVEPNWAGALAAMYLKRSPEEIARADRFFAEMPLDEEIDPDMRVCEALHSYYLFRDDPQLSSAARQRLLDIVRFRPAPRRINDSIWKFGATENHAFMGHVWCLLTAQIDRDHDTAALIGDHIGRYIIEHIRKGWLEYNSPCYVEKEVGCLVMVAEWAQDPLLRYKARLGLDVLFAEHAALNLEGMLGGPACRVYGFEPEIPLDEFGHNSRRDARCSGSHAMMYMLFGEGSPWYYGVLGAPMLATSRYEAPRAVIALATAGDARGSDVFRARRPGRKHRAFRRDPSLSEPPPEVFDTRVYAWVTPDYVLGSFQEVEGRYGATRALPLSCVLRMAGSPLRTIYVDLVPDDRQGMFDARVNCVQQRNVALAQGAVGRAYLATDEFEELLEQDGWILARAGSTYAACRLARGGYTWMHADNPSIHGDFIQFEHPESAFVLEAARARDYRGDFGMFRDDILNNRIQLETDAVSYESCDEGVEGPSSESFVVKLRDGELPLVNGEPLVLESYDTFDSKHLLSTWDSGIVRLSFGGERLTINVSRPNRPLRIEETIEPVPPPYATGFDEAAPAWVPFLNYWRLRPEQWYWDAVSGHPGGALNHNPHRGVEDPDRGAHDAAILLRGGERWADYAFEADARAAKGSFGLWFRADMHDEGGGSGRWVQGYYFILDPGHRRWRLWRARNDGFVAEGSDRPEENHFSNPLLLQEGGTGDRASYAQWLRLRAEVRGPEIRCFIDDQEVVNLRDSFYRSGSVGFATYKGRDVSFDNVRVSPLAP